MGKCKFHILFSHDLPLITLECLSLPAILHYLFEMLLPPFWVEPASCPPISVLSFIVKEPQIFTLHMTAWEKLD